MGDMCEMLDRMTREGLTEKWHLSKDLKEVRETRGDWREKWSRQKETQTPEGRRVTGALMDSREAHVGCWRKEGVGRWGVGGSGDQGRREKRRGREWCKYCQQKIRHSKIWLSAPIPHITCCNSFPCFQLKYNWYTLTCFHHHTSKVHSIFSI